MAVDDRGGGLVLLPQTYFTDAVAQPASRTLLAEFLGTLLLLAIVVGSGIMGERLAGGNSAVALLANAGATAGGLYVLIVLFGPISGAHFNPAVTMVMRLSGGRLPAPVWPSSSAAPTPTPRA